MAQSNEELDSLRSQAKLYQRRVGNKISRLKSKAGVDIAHSKLDPRRNWDTVKKYNSRQLKAYNARLETFQERATQFVPDAHGRAMRSSVMDSYKAKERKWNEKVDKTFAKVADIQLPGTKFTVAEREAQLTPKHRVANPVINKPRKYDLKSSQIDSEKALKELSKNMDKRLKSDWFAKESALAKQLFIDKLAPVIGDAKLAADIQGMSDYRFGLMWRYSGFAEIEFHEYHMMKSQQDEQGIAFSTEIFDQKKAQAREAVDWAGALDLDPKDDKNYEPPQAATKPKTKRRR